MASVTLEPSVGNGSATIEHTGSRQSPYYPGYDDTVYYYETYHFIATPDSGWQFDHWERRQRLGTSYRDGRPDDWDTWSNWTRVAYANSEWTSEFFVQEDNPESSSYYDEIYKREYQVRAVFTSVVQTYTVTVVADPAAGGNVTGGGTYSSGSTCTIVAVANAGYVFEGWTSSDGRTADTATHTFTVTGEVTWTAHFGYETTGELLYALSSGALLCGNSGTLLFKG